MSNKEKAQIVDFLMDVLVKAAEQEVDCCFDLDHAAGCCAMEVEPCCRTCNKPVSAADLATEFSGEYLCSNCRRFVTVSPALYCWACEVCLFPEDMREQIHRARKRCNARQIDGKTTVKMPGKVLQFRRHYRGGHSG